MSVVILSVFIENPAWTILHTSLERVVSGTGGIDPSDGRAAAISFRDDAMAPVYGFWQFEMASEEPLLVPFSAGPAVAVGLYFPVDLCNASAALDVPQPEGRGQLESGNVL